MTPGKAFASAEKGCEGGDIICAFAVASEARGVIGKLIAGVVELVDALDSKSSSERSVGSIPTARTKNGSRTKSDPLNRSDRFSGPSSPNL